MSLFTETMNSILMSDSGEDLIRVLETVLSFLRRKTRFFDPYSAVEVAFEFVCARMIGSEEEQLAMVYDNMIYDSDYNERCFDSQPIEKLTGNGEFDEKLIQSLQEIGSFNKMFEMTLDWMKEARPNLFIYSSPDGYKMYEAINKETIYRRYLLGQMDIHAPLPNIQSPVQFALASTCQACSQVYKDAVKDDSCEHCGERRQFVMMRCYCGTIFFEEFKPTSCDFCGDYRRTFPYSVPQPAPCCSCGVTYLSEDSKFCSECGKKREVEGQNKKRNIDEPDSKLCTQSRRYLPPM